MVKITETDTEIEVLISGSDLGIDRHALLIEAVRSAGLNVKAPDGFFPEFEDYYIARIPKPFRNSEE